MADQEIARSFNRVTQTWPGGEHTFALNIGELFALQQICEAGPNIILSRLASGAWEMSDITAVLRLGLIGGGMDDVAAKKLVNNALTTSPLLGFVMPAHIILAAALVGAVGDDLQDDESSGDSDDDDGDASGNGQAPKTV